MLGDKTDIYKEPAMSIVTLSLPDVKQKTEIRPKTCPYCTGKTFQRWGRVSKPVKDNRYRIILVYRYHCCQCHRTFRYYPNGVDRADQTLRLRKLSTLLWILGMSLRGTCTALSIFDVQLSHMSLWRNLQEQADDLEKQRHWKPVRVLGIDGLYPLGKGRQQPVLIAVDLGTGQPVAIGHVNEYDPWAVRRFLEPLIKRLGVGVIVSDDLITFHRVTEKLGVEHQVCQFHVRRWVGRTLHELRETVPKDWHWVLDEIKALLAELPPEGSRRLFELWKQIPERHEAHRKSRSALTQLRELLIRLSEYWPSYRVFDWQKDVPWTNNATEQAIGRMKMRSRTVRGYKSWRGMWAAGMLSCAGVSW
jgi:transposase-like protein